jgi:hypothetical protein
MLPGDSDQNPCPAISSVMGVLRRLTLDNSMDHRSIVSCGVPFPNRINE